MLCSMRPIVGKPHDCPLCKLGIPIKQKRMVLVPDVDGKNRGKYMFVEVKEEVAK